MTFEVFCQASVRLSNIAAFGFAVTCMYGFMHFLADVC